MLKTQEKRRTGRAGREGGKWDTGEHASIMLGNGGDRQSGGLSSPGVVPKLCGSDWSPDPMLSGLPCGSPPRFLWALG